MALLLATKAVSGLGTTVVTTIEAIGETPTGKRIQGAWLELEVVQRGYLQPGKVMSASALLAGTRIQAMPASMRS
jgi:isoquinoline 1-oxidoreductase subunit alpha